MMKRYATAIVCMLYLLLPAISLAGNKALLIGVGNFKYPYVNDLKGIDLDVSMMREVASIMGFRNDQIKTLENKNATYDNVQKTIKNWIIDHVAADDKVLIYFSTHGSYVADRNGDEEDGRDEVIVLYDTRVIKDSSGETKLENILIDDELGQLLGRIQSKNTMVVMDCCHSGTNYRTIKLRPSTIPATEVQEKFFYYPGIPKSGFVPHKTKRQSDGYSLNYVSLAACRDTERSLASPHGSFFTLGIRSALRRSAAKNQNVTPLDITKSAAAFVDREIPDPSRKFHPQITGNETLKMRRIELVSMNSGYGPVWQDLIKLTQRATDRVPIRINKSCYEINDALVMNFQIPQAGYLNVISVGADDQPTVLFPNKRHPDTIKIPGGSIQIPTDRMNFELTAMDKGPVLIVALLTSKPINLYAQGFKTKDQMFAALSPKASHRNFGVTEKKSDFFYAGKRITKIVAHGNCRKP
jgi:hypothetical protein